jgi:hypothetical protein
MTQDRKIESGSPGKGFQENISTKYRSSHLVFANLLTSRHRQPPATNTLNFVKYVIGKKLAGDKRTGFEGSMIYRKPGQALHQSFYTWIVKSVLSLTVNRLEQCFGVWLNQVYTLQMLPSLETRVHLVAATRSEFLNRPAGKPEPFEALNKIERSLQTVYANNTGRQSTQVLRLPSFQTILPWLNLYAARRADEIRREFRVSVLETQSRVFIRPQQNGASEHSDSVRARDRLWQGAAQGFYRTTSLALNTLAFSARGMAEKIRMAERIEAVYATKPLAGFEAAFRTVTAAGFASRSPVTGSGVAMHHLNSPRKRRAEHRQGVTRWPGALIGIENLSKQRNEADLSFIGIKLLKVERGTGLRDVNEETFAPLLNREMGDGTIKAYNPITRGGVSKDLSFLRREEQLRPPPQSYAFAQPVRSTIVEEQIVKHTQEKEVVEIVRKEVEVAMKSRSPIAGLSRADYSRITDQVYSSLARRLLMEKERKGLSF